MFPSDRYCNSDADTGKFVVFAANTHEIYPKAFVNPHQFTELITSPLSSSASVLPARSLPGHKITRTQTVQSPPGLPGWSNGFCTTSSQPGTHSPLATRHSPLTTHH